MPFEERKQEPLLEGILGQARVTILGTHGLRLSGLNSFHLDEGPDFAWLNIYRVLADCKQLDILRERIPSSISIEEGDVVVRWDCSPAIKAEITARYHLIEADMSVDVTFEVCPKTDYSNFELFIANYFTPYYTPRYAVSDNRAHPEGVFWYEKKWFDEDENDAWPRDAEARKIFHDGRWLTGYSLNWRLGPDYALPLMTQEHKYAHAIILMAQPEDCIGISGFNSYHNSQYFHLFGRNVKAEQSLATTVRMVLLTEWDNLNEQAVIQYEKWRKK
ncbi:hypothetical protein H8E77_41365 [bacterium]|nr:hypothetical protein [bacterium]